MSDNRAGSQWQWSESLQARCCYDARRDVYITEDGRTFQLQASQSSREIRQPPPAFAEHARDLITGGSRHRTGSYGSTGLGAQYGIVPGADPGSTDASHGLDAMMSDLRVSHPEPPTTVLRGFDQQQRIETRYQIYPPEEITQPELFEKGFTARAKVLRTRGSQEELDPGFRLRKAPRKFFVVGKVFLVLWAEPFGSGAAGATKITSVPIIIPGKHKQQVFSKVRRFIVVREGDQSCSALPITTYTHQGADKRRINIAEHGVVYTGRGPDRDASRVPGLQPVAIRINPDSRDDKLDPQSLVHYGKVYTIEHNVKVKPYGVVHDDSIEPFIGQFYRVWVENIGLRKTNVSNAAQATGNPPARQAPESSRAAQSRLAQEPMSLTQQQRAAIEEHSGAVEGRAQMARRSSNADRRSVRSLTRASETTTVSSNLQEEIRQLYRTVVAATENQGYSTEVAEAAAKRKVELTYPQFAGIRNAIPATADASSRSLSQPTNEGATADTSASIEAAISALMARGLSRQEAVQRLKEGLLARQDAEGGPSTSSARGKKKGKEKEK